MGTCISILVVVKYTHQSAFKDRKGNCILHIPKRIRLEDQGRDLWCRDWVSSLDVSFHLKSARDSHLVTVTFMSMSASDEVFVPSIDTSICAWRHPSSISAKALTGS